MAAARQCDRCKDYYIPEAVAMSKLKFRVNSIDIQHLSYALNKVTDYERFDLCTKCLRSLNSWLVNVEKR